MAYVVIRPRVIRPKSSCNSWSTIDEEPFVSLNVHDNLRVETYLAAFLVSWLSVFVLPTEDAGSALPNTFKMACIMAIRRVVSLVVPVLTSLYRGLGRLAQSRRPSRILSPVLLRYFYSWSVHFFKTHYLIHKGVDSPKMVIYSGEGGARYYNPRDARLRVLKGDFFS